MATMTSDGRAKASGPRRSRRGYWRVQVAAHEKSGLSVAAFCRQHGLRKGTLSFWRWKFAQEGPPTPRRASATFVPVRLAPTPPALGSAPAVGDLEIAIGPGRSVRVRGRVEPTWLAQVLEVVAALRC
jgi:hypothetical protein